MTTGCVINRFLKYPREPSTNLELATSERLALRAARAEGALRAKLQKTRAKESASPEAQA